MINKVASMISRHRRILVFTGAGVSTGSGIPDFRGPKGVWRTESPVYYQDFMTSIDARREYWRQKQSLFEVFKIAQPNAVHRSIVQLEQAGKVDMVVTQNVDGLHRAAGTSVGKIIELHGTNTEVECQTCSDRSDPTPHFASFRKTGEPPSCKCGGYLKPATISFGQSLRPDDLMVAFAAAATCDLVLALGSTLSVSPAADIPLRATQRGVPYVVINYGSTAHDGLGVTSLRIDDDVESIVPSAVDVALTRTF